MSSWKVKEREVQKKKNFPGVYTWYLVSDSFFLKYMW